MDTLRKKLFLKLATLMFLICITGGASYVLSSVAGKSRDYADKLNADIRGLESRLQQFKQDNARLEEALKIWEDMSGSERAFAGLRLGEAKTELDRMVKKYWLSDVKTTFSKPDLKDHPVHAEYRIAESSVTVSFNAVSDAMALEFLDEMNASFPGHILFRRVSLEKKQQLTKDIIKDVASGNRPALFAGVLEFEWRDIKK
jgi:hypothetical protein